MGERQWCAHQWLDSFFYILFAPPSLLCNGFFEFDCGSGYHLSAVDTMILIAAAQGLVFCCGPEEPLDVQCRQCLLARPFSLVSPYFVAL